MQNRNDSYFKVYKTTALQMSDFTNSMQLYVYEHAVVDLSDRYWRGQSDVNSHCSIFLTTCRNAEVQCGGEPITLKPYCFYFLPSQLRLTLVRHDHARLYHTLFRMNSWSGLDLWHLLKPHAVELNEYPPELLEKYLACARTENTPAPHDNAAISGELGLMAILYELLSLIWKAGKWELPLHNPDTLDRIERVVNFIENNLERNHPVPELARLACMSREHFTLEFRKIIGMPPARYQTERKLQQIRLLLLRDTQTLGELAERFGFSNAFHLSRVFKQHFGIAPKFFRQRRSLF